MSTTALQKMRKRAEKAESIAIGMGFLLLKLRSRFGGQLGIGMTEQVDQAITNYRRLCAAKPMSAQKAASTTTAAQAAHTTRTECPSN